MFGVFLKKWKHQVLRIFATDIAESNCENETKNNILGKKIYLLTKLFSPKEDRIDQPLIRGVRGEVMPAVTADIRGAVRLRLEFN